MGNGLVDQAVRFLVDFGLPMVPSKGNEKKPCFAWKVFQRQRPTADQIRVWDKKFRPERWGLVTGQLSGRVVADFDGDEGLRWMKEWGINPHLRTGSGGFHCHLAHPGWLVPTLNAKSGKKSWPWPGVDIRGDGGFAVLLGRNNNGPYVQLRELVPEPFEALPKEVRIFLHDHSKTEHPASKRTPPCPQPIKDREDRVDCERLIRMALAISSREGRNNGGFWLACQLRDNRFDQREAESAMRCYLSRVSSTNTKGKRESYTEREMLASLKQAYSCPARAPWEKLASRPHSGGALPAVRSRQHGRRRETDPPGRKEIRMPTDRADDPDSMCLYVGYPSRPQVGYPSIPLASDKYGKVPRAVYADPNLEARDVRIYCVLASFVFQGSVARVGKRLIAKQACCAECTVRDRLRRLESAGHIQIIPVRRGCRGLYHLVSPVFGQKQRADIQETITAPNGQRRLATARKDQSVAWSAIPPALRRKSK